MSLIAARELPFPPAHFGYHITYREGRSSYRLTPGRRVRMLRSVALVGLTRLRSIPVEQLTPTALADLYALLSADDKTAFLRLLGQVSTAETMLVLQNALPILEKGRYKDTMNERFAGNMFPPMLREAIRVAREFPAAEEVELAKLVIKRLADSNRLVQDLALAQFKAARDPKKRMAERDNEIVRLRDVESKSFGEIPRMLLAKNPSWSRTGGKPMTRDAVERAYQRRKGLGT